MHINSIIITHGSCSKLIFMFFVWFIHISLVLLWFMTISRKDLNTFSRMTNFHLCNTRNSGCVISRHLVDISLRKKEIWKGPKLAQMFSVNRRADTLFTLCKKFGRDGVFPQTLKILLESLIYCSQLNVRYRADAVSFHKTN